MNELILDTNGFSYFSTISLVILGILLILAGCIAFIAMIFSMNDKVEIPISKGADISRSKLSLIFTSFLFFFLGYYSISLVFENWNTFNTIQYSKNCNVVLKNYADYQLFSGNLTDDNLVIKIKKSLLSGKGVRGYSYYYSIVLSDKEFLSPIWIGTASDVNFSNEAKSLGKIFLGCGKLRNP